MKSSDSYHPFLIVLGILLLAGAGAGSWWVYSRMATLSGEVASIKSTLASTTELLIQTIEENLASSAALTEEKEALEEQLEDLSGTVNTLEKLSKIDPELLQKYSKVFFLNEHYVPERLTEIPDAYEYTATEHNLILSPVWSYLRKMLDTAKRDKVEIYVSSAYRSFDEQDALKGQYSVTYGAGTANQFSADQGYSEHQLGTTVDLTTTGIGGSLSGFQNTPAYQWLLKNAHRWGFVLSYPPGNAYYLFEPWHWRFVGEDLADDLHDDGKYFYDLDQREIDKYLISLFD